MLPAENRIIGGEVPTKGHFRHVASLQSKTNAHICGAAIINAHWLLTTGKCASTLTQMDEVYVRTGSHSYNSGGVRHVVSNIVVHPNFKSGARLNDIALVQTKSTIVKNAQTAPIGLPLADHSSGQATMAGWGQTDLDRTAKSHQLRTLSTTIISMATCKKELTPVGLSRFVQRTNICTNAGAGHGFCNWDLGGPLNVDNELVGIASFGEPCATGVADVYTRVYSYVQWINENAV